MGSPLFATKPIETLMNEADESGEHCLKRALGPINLVTLGIGAIIGAGIFVITGQAAAQFAGPAIIISFVLAGVACAFAGLCYAEFASLIPIAGSAYTYSYATLGELIAWIIGWDLILEYAFGAATVAVGWSGHLRAFLRDVGWNLPAIPTSSFTLFGLPVQLKYDYVGFLVIMAITAILVIGIKESANFTTAIVILKVAVVCLFIALATRFLSSHDWKPNFWHPFIPANTGVRGEFGWSGILRGAGVVFFAYIGFDAVSTAAQEAKNPKKDMPLGILGSLVICTVLYILVSGLLTHLVPYTQLNVPDPVVVGIRTTGQQDPSPLPHAVYQFHRRGRFCGDSGYAPSPAYPRRNDECGHAARLCAGQRRSGGSAADAPGVKPPVQNSAGTVGSHPGDWVLGLANRFSFLLDAAQVGGLAGHWVGDLLHLRRDPQQSSQRRQTILK